MADGGVWKLQDDGYLNIDAEPDSVIYHPDLNILIVLSRNAESIVVDINSGSVLRKCVFSDESQPVKGTYLPSYDKVLFTNNKAVGVRSDYNGVLLLDTMLQTCLKNKTSTGSKNNNIKLEILVSEAILLQQTLKTIETSDCEFSPALWTDVLSQLEAKIEVAQSEPKKSAKSQKWNIICLELEPGSFKTCYCLVSELKRQNRHVPALAIASAINERLNRLNAIPFPPDVAAPQADTRNLMFSEAARRETFTKWPHMDYKWALPDQMAQAGFYHQPNATGDDRAMCFTCTVCLVCWEPNDEPWAEHERHSPCCPFVKGEYTQNVPLSVTYATAPALPLKHRLAPAMNLVDISTLPGYIPLVSCDGHATVLNFVRQLKVETELSVSKLCNDHGLTHSVLSVSAAAIASHVKHSVKCSETPDDAEQDSESQGQPVPGPCLLLGTQVTTSPELVTLLRQRLESGTLTTTVDSKCDESSPSSQLLLLVLDFHYPRGAGGSLPCTGGPAGTNKKAISGTGTSTATMAGTGCKLNQWENKAMAMYHQPLIDEIMDDDFLVTVSSSPQPSTSNSSSDVTHSELKKELWSLLETSNLCSTSLKKLRLAVENKLNCDLSQRVLEFGDIVTSYLQDLTKKETGGTAMSSDLFNSMLKNKDAYDQPFYGFMDDDMDPSFDSMDGVGFSFVPPASAASIKALESEAFALETEVNASLAQSKAVPGLIQIVRVPCQSTDTQVTEIHPLLDHLHVLVILSDGSLHLYSLDHTDKVCKLSDFPVQSLHPQVSGDGLRRAILLPQDQSSNVVAGLTDKGSLVLMDVLTLRLLSRLDPPEETEFVTLTYCNSLERICVATSKGSLRFYALRDEDEFRLREENSSSPVMTKKKTNSSQHSSSSTNASGTSVNELITHRPSYGLSELRSLYSLTLFETLSPGYSAAVPPCWSELMQAQKQRRHAQHLTREDIHTRSWRLQNDLTTWDEHMFELCLPKNTCVGQVDVKLALHTPCPQVPPLQVTLLRPITSRAPFQSSSSGSNTIPTGDATGSFSSEDFGTKANPVTSDFYSNFEILCGPVNISNCLDLSDQSCTIAFSSPRLLNTKNRQLLVHIKALNFVNTPHKSKSKDKDPSSGKPTPVSSLGGLTCINMIKSSSGSSSGGVTGEFRNLLFGNGGSAIAKKSESFIGCDWIHEISITIRKSKSTDIPNERLERSVMLESPSVLEKLLQAVTSPSSTAPAQCIALDILIWIAVIRLGRLRSTQDSAGSQDSQFAFVKLVESQLGDLCHACFIRGGRSIARKCAKLLVICSDGAKNATDASKVVFDASLLRVLVDLLPHICMAWSAGSVRWFFQMLNKVMVLDTNATAPQRCLDILNAVGAQLQARQNPYHLILRTRFGLHGSPLEPEIFDMEPLLPSRVSGAVPVSYSHGMGGSDGAWVSSNNSWFHVSSTPFTSTCPAGLSSEPLDWRELLMPSSSEGKATPASKMKGVSLSHYMKGLLEAEPLHFTCSAMCDGTKLEKIDPQPATPVFTMYSGPSAGPAKTRTTPGAVLPDSCIIVDASSPDVIEMVGHSGTMGSSLPNTWTSGGGSFEPKMTSGDFFKSFTSSDMSGGGAGGQDFMDASTSTPLETSASAGTVTGGVASTVSGAGQEEPHWSSLLVPPPQQVMVIERMHSGARRFIVLDFGRPVLLTDLLIPACSELLSLSIDIWVKSEEADALRLVVTPDIALKNLILSDIQPPPICRYLKITTIGRYGMSTAKCKVPVGSYYGHTLILPGEDYAEKNANSASCETNIKAQLQLLSSLHEDIYCRYSLCCTKLKQHMSQLLLSETPNVVHMHRYFNRKKENNLFLPEPKDKIISCYKECVTYQHQLNIVKSVIRRLSPPAVTKEPFVLAGSSDKLRIIGECLLDSVLYYVYEIGPVPKAPSSLSLKLDEDLCSRLFSAFCITEETRLQVAMAALLVATCGSKPWWGDFLTRRFCHLYASQQALIFPQDRTLMLFSWLGRKSLSLCASLVDSLLLALLTHLSPLAHVTPTAGYLRARTDLSLITWLLMFLSQVLDCSCGDANKSFGTRWNFMCGELAMQKQKLKPKASITTGRGNRTRRLQKKLMNQSTSHISDLMKPTHHNKDSIDKAKSSSSGSSSNGAGSSSGVASGSSGKNAECLVTPLISLPRHHCLPSARAILAFILHLDYTCNVDTFLIACKDLSRIVISTSPTLSLPELLSESELLHLLRLAVWSDQHRAVWGGPWTLHALTCLLLDMLDAASVTVNAAASVSNVSPPGGEEESATAPCSPSSQSTSPPSLSPYALPSVLESDDSDLEDFLDDILERGRILVHKVPAFVPKSSMGGISCSMSLAMDSRLEYGVENNAEVTLKRLTAQSAYNLPISINSSLPSVVDSVPASEWSESVTSPWEREETQLSGVTMLSNCFNTLFSELDTLTGWSNIEQILELWLTLNGSGKSSGEDSTGRKFNASYVPVIPLAETSITTLIKALTLRPNVSLRTWCLSFETLTLATNMPVTTTSGPNTSGGTSDPLIGMARVIIGEPTFVRMIFTFMSSTQLKTNQLAGPSVCSAFRQFMVRLQARCDILSFSSSSPGEISTGIQLKQHLLSLLYLLVQHKGPLSCQAGPLDVQCEFVMHLLHLHFSAHHLPTAMSILESIGMLLYSYVTSLDTLKCLSVNEASVNNPLSCFHNAWSSLMTSSSSPSNSSDAKLLKLPSHQTLMLNLLRFATKLVQIPLDENYAGGDGNSQTDEHKAEQNLYASSSPPCLADVVLRHNTSMEHLLTSLACASSSSFAMILSSSNNLAFTDNLEPSCVGDGVFQLLVTLTAKASTRALALTPILQFLSNWNKSSHGVFQFSEPFVWLLMKTINSPESVQELVNLGGVAVICQGLIQSHSLVINPHPSQVSVLMQHLSQFPAYNLVGAGGPGTSSKKANAPPVPDSWTYPPKLINFAPLGTITTPNAASQTPDVLIQSTPPHRRARSPAWSYHFFADESSVELTITLPCAILLKEIQLQPHVSALCTCPSAVGLEVCHGLGTGMVPVGPPLETAGLTFIRLNLPSPEVVTGVLLRLYRAKDSSSLGLTQIRVIGATSFGDTAFQMCNAAIPDEAKLTKSSIGWLRVLSHVIGTPRPESPLLKSLLDATSSSSPLLLDALASLLLLPAPPPSLYAPGLKHVLLSLGLHSKQLGLALLDILLHNGAVTFMQGTLPLGKNTTASLESVVELIYMLCTTQDAHTLDRLTLLLSWLRSTAQDCLKEDSHLPPASIYIHCASVVLWSLQEQGLLSSELRSLVSDELFLSVYAWTLQVKDESALKTALDNVLCSMCFIRPCLFSTLLHKMGILIPESLNSASDVDDRKDYNDLTDDSKERVQSVLCDLRKLKVSEPQLMTVAAACQSPAATSMLLSSGLASRLASAVLEFCTSHQTDTDKATNHNGLTLHANHVGTILKFFSALCSTAVMKDWLGSPEGSVFWFPLLSYLDQKTSESSGFGYSWELSSVIPQLEALTIKLLSQATSVHPANQKLLALVLSDLIASHMSGFTRRLVLQLLLENEKVLVCIDRPAVNAGDFTSALPHPHPSFGIGHKQHLLYLPTDTTISDILLCNLASTSTSDLPGMLKYSLKTPSSSCKSERDPQLSEIQETLSATLTAGNTAKDKRLKESKHAAKPLKKRTLGGGDSSVLSLSHYLVWSVKHDQIPEELPHAITLSQLLYLYPPQTPHLKLSISTPSINNNNNTASSSHNNEEKVSSLLNTPHLQTPLQVFSQLGGLALLAQHLPAVNPDAFQSPALDRCEPGSKYMYYCGEEQSDADWVKIDFEIYEDIEDINDMTEPESSGGTCKNKKPAESASGSSGMGGTVPPHSLAAFGLFLRLPGYADVLLRDKKRAMFLLRLVLGVSDDGEGGDIFKSSVARSLPTLPFHTLQILLQGSPLSTDDGALLRQTALDIGVLHLLLTCLAYLTHLPTDLSPPVQTGFQQVNAGPSASNNQKPNPSSGSNDTVYTKSDDKSHLYWAKGTGFGTGSTTQNWNIEHALSRQRLEEEHVTALLRVLSAFIGSSPELAESTHPVSSEQTSSAVHSSSAHLTTEPNSNPTLVSSSTKKHEPPPPPLPPLLKQLIKQSCLLPALSSYLRNDSVLDMARHIPLYRGVLELIRSMVRDPELGSLLLPSSPDTPGPASSSDSTSIYVLLCNIKSCVDIYMSRLKSNDNASKSKASKANTTTSVADTKNRKVSWQDQDEDLITLVDDIRGTVAVVQSLATEPHEDTPSAMPDVLQPRGGLSSPPVKTLEERYLEIMRGLQFGMYDMVVAQDEEGTGFKFTVAYHFESNVRSSGERCHPSRNKRLAQETVTLSTALPLSYSSSVFVRCDNDRLDIMKVLITGPSDTPYANGCFEFDVYFPPEYPGAPMIINLCTTGRHSVRFNPNLYNDGKVCLSILNTWHGRPEEKWNAHTSSFLQVLVSIQSLILVPEPYFNEPGYERSRGTVQGTQSSREYNANIAQATVKWAMLEQIRNPTPCFKHVIHTHFWLKRREILEQVKAWIADLDTQVTDKRTGRAISLNTLALKRHFNFLLEELVKLKVPPGLEDLADQHTLTETELAEMKVFISADSPFTSNAATSFFSLGEDEETEEEQHS